MNIQQEKTSLPGSEKRELKRRAHPLKPVVRMGKKGISMGLMDEIDRALKAHELIKLQVERAHKENLDENIFKIMCETHAQHIDTVGNVVILFRKNDDASLFDNLT
jgi:RNA-binding protein